MIASFHCSLVVYFIITSILMSVIIYYKNKTKTPERKHWLKNLGSDREIQVRRGMESMGWNYKDFWFCNLISVAVKSFHVCTVFECFRLLLIIGLECLQRTSEFLIQIYEVFYNTALKSNVEKKKNICFWSISATFSAQKNFFDKIQTLN